MSKAIKKKRDHTKNIRLSLKQVFNVSDFDGDGLIPFEQLVPAMQSGGYAVCAEQLAPYLESAGQLEAGHATYEEFRMLCQAFNLEINRKELLSESFSMLNYDKADVVPLSQMESYLSKSGLRLSSAELDAFFSHVKVKEGNVKIEDIINKLASIKLTN